MNKPEERAAKLFKLLVESYLENGKPVASRSLAGRLRNNVSSATVRNVMARLEGRGLVKSPHPSAGKVPTHQGLRFFVDALLTVEPMDDDNRRSLESWLNPDLPPSELAESASEWLSRMTAMACLVTLPKRDQSALRHVEFLNLEGDRILVILVFQDREVQNRVIHSDRSYEDADLVRAANYINQEFAGLSLEAVREGLLASMQRDKDRMDALLQSALDLASRTFASQPADEKGFVVSGESNLLDLSEDTETVRRLFDAFTRKSSFLHLLDQSLSAEGVQLYIGEESGYNVLDELTLVSSSYCVHGQIAGVLGVVGPTRMAYQRVIPAVDVTAQLLGAALNQG